MRGAGGCKRLSAGIASKAERISSRLLFIAPGGARFLRRLSSTTRAVRHALSASSIIIAGFASIGPKSGSSWFSKLLFGIQVALELLHTVEEQVRPIERRVWNDLLASSGMFLFCWKLDIGGAASSESSWARTQEPESRSAGQWMQGQEQREHDLQGRAPQSDSPRCLL